jgi:hypothetical protein
MNKRESISGLRLQSTHSPDFSHFLQESTNHRGISPLFRNHHHNYQATAVQIQEQPEPPSTTSTLQNEKAGPGGITLPDIQGA